MKKRWLILSFIGIISICYAIGMRNNIDDLVVFTPCEYANNNVTAVFNFPNMSIDFIYDNLDELNENCKQPSIFINKDILFGLDKEKLDPYHGMGVGFMPHKPGMVSEEMVSNFKIHTDTGLQLQLSEKLNGIHMTYDKSKFDDSGNPERNELHLSVMLNERIESISGFESICKYVTSFKKTYLRLPDTSKMLRSYPPAKNIEGHGFMYEQMYSSSKDKLMYKDGLSNVQLFSGRIEFQRRFNEKVKTVILVFGTTLAGIGFGGIVNNLVSKERNKTDKDNSQNDNDTSKRSR